MAYTDYYEKLMTMKSVGAETWDAHMLLSLKNDSTNTLATKIFSARDESLLVDET